MQRIAAPATFDTESFFDGRAQLLGISVDADCPVINTPLRQLTDLFSTLRAIVVGIRRDGGLFAPASADQIFAGDEVYVFTVTEDMARTLEIFGKTQTKMERVVIIGGGNVGQSVARALENRSDRVRVKIIERNRAIAERAADALDRTIVLNGDGLDVDLLEEAGVARADAVLVVTDDDKTNLLASVRAKGMGAKMAICLMNDPTLVPLLSAARHRRLHQPARRDRLVDPAPRPPRPGAQRLFHRRCRGRADRGAGARHLADRRPADPRHRVSRRRAGGRACSRATDWSSRKARPGSRRAT